MNSFSKLKNCYLPIFKFTRFDDLIWESRFNLRVKQPILRASVNFKKIRWKFRNRIPSEWNRNCDILRMSRISSDFEIKKSLTNKNTGIQLNNKNEIATYNLCNQFHPGDIPSNKQNRCCIQKSIRSSHSHSFQCNHCVNQGRWRAKWDQIW